MTPHGGSCLWYANRCHFAIAAVEGHESTYAHWASNLGCLRALQVRHHRHGGFAPAHWVLSRLQRSLATMGDEAECLDVVGAMQAHADGPATFGVQSRYVWYTEAHTPHLTHAPCLCGRGLLLLAVLIVIFPPTRVVCTFFCLFGLCSHVKVLVTVRDSVSTHAVGQARVKNKKIRHSCIHVVPYLTAGFISGSFLWVPGRGKHSWRPSTMSFLVHFFLFRMRVSYHIIIDHIVNVISTISVILLIINIINRKFTMNKVNFQ